ncbi:hypothetical protein PPGU19_015070 [Paraburkholderia sp. PGU19]|uniref:hypothetical protein n=1 Tax=Paraburkholderia sp. PGU19 TaxID=2735434 RepID=UPI0015DB6271|nr:hypothetical protein [Paraburkholderia sp. PGU19]BCF96938.1 hypothetical protein PPGU19_015070 [Paraburkholderia sp. PGU19]
MTLTIANQKTTAPNPSYGDQAFQTCLIESKIAFEFATVEHLKTFLKDRAIDFTNAKTKFEDPQYQALFSPIIGFAYEDRSSKSQLSTLLKIKTIVGVFEVELFVSLKRHALISFTNNYVTPRDAKQMNSIVRDAVLLKKCFDEYVALLTAEAQKQGYFFQVAPQKLNNTMIFGAMTMSSDSLPISQIPAKGFKVHVFPSGGPEVRMIPDHAQYKAMVTFLLWYYRTDECTGMTQTVDEVTRMELKLGGENLQYKSYVQRLDKLAAQVKQSCSELKKGGVDFAKVYADGEVDRALHKPAGDGCKALYELLYKHGVIPSLQAPTRLASRNPDAAKAYKAPIVDKTNTVIFKTHKVEVCSTLKHMPWDIIAWLLEGKLAIDLSSGKPQVRLMLEAYKVDKEKYKSVSHDDNAEVIRKMSHMKTRADVTKELIESFASPSKKPHEKINRFIELYQVAVTSNIDRLKDIATL